MRIAIVGGGLGGLAAALFLREAGFTATVYEQASLLREVGAGIVVAPNMVRPLAKLGLARQLSVFAVRLEAAWEFRRWKDGRVLFVQPMGAECERLYGAPCYVAHRRRNRPGGRLADRVMDGRRRDLGSDRRVRRLGRSPASIDL